MALPLLAQEDGAAFFEKNIRPLLVSKCLSCHSATSQPIMGGLRLDSRELMLKGGTRGASVIAGNPADSLLMKVILHTAGALKMPPGPKMKDPDTALFAQWIAMGAPWGNTPLVSSTATKSKYWSFIPPTNPALPTVKNTAWVRSPIDNFILSALEAKGLAPAQPADKRTLIRRVTYDLTGLPPTPEQVQSFLDDNSKDAYAKVVDRLLASPRYGERWGRHWLDVARYADSNGLDENLVYRNAFRYRDYVIAAFNQDKPYDQFIREQLAGDLLPESSDLKIQFERWTATGFLSLGAKMLAEDDPVKMQMDIVDEQLDTTARAFMGLTVGCARCHDHKFDPIPTADYYAMAGIFKSSLTMDHFKVVAKWHEHVLAPKPDRDLLAAHEAKLEAKRKEISDLTKAENKKLTDIEHQRIGSYLRAAREILEGNKVKIAPVEDDPAALTRLATQATKTDKTLEFAIEIAKAGNYQLDLLNEEKGSGTSDIYVNGVWMKQADPPVQNRVASPESGGWKYVAIIPLKQGSNTIRFEHRSKTPKFDKLLLAAHTGPYTPPTTVQAAAKHQVNPDILDELIYYFEQSQAAASSVFHDWEVNPNDALAPVYEQRFKDAIAAGKDTKDPQLKAAYNFLHEKFGPFRAPSNARRYYSPEVQAKLKQLDAEAKTLEAATPDFPKAMGAVEYDKAEDIPIHIRGSHWNLGEKAPRGFLRAIDTGYKPTFDDKHSGRLELAEWLTSPNHPLTSRVMVNRIWRGHFGRGIVATTDNFGRLGEKPSHPELLDWLALRFIEQRWSVKALHRMILLSSTYQMSSEYSAKSNDVDPENILLWRMPRRRLEAEAIRDAVMSASGALDFTMGGTLLTYKDRQYVANTSKGSTVDYDRPIRAIYVPVLRSSMYEVFSAFDLPDPTMSNGDRDSTVVAPQALFMMNSSVILKHSLKMAESLQTLEPNARIAAAYQRALSRPPTNQEVDQALTFIAKMQKEWNGDSLKAWQSFCKSLLASSEFIYLN